MQWGESGWVWKGEGPVSALNASLPSLARDDRDQRREGAAVGGRLLFLTSKNNILLLKMEILLIK